MSKIVIPSADYAHMPEVCGLAKQYDMLYAAVGVHPDESGQERSIEDEIKLARSLATHPKVVAVGEVGLDFFRLQVETYVQESEHQRQRLSAFWHLAKEMNLPIILHSRAAHPELIAEIKRLPYGPLAVVHCFTGDLAEAYQLLDLGLMISVTGILTFKKSQALREVIKQIPLERLMLETDAPYLAPEGRRGQESTPDMVWLVAQVLAELKGLSVQEIERETDANAERFFNFQSLTAQIY